MSKTFAKGQDFNALARVSSLMNSEQRKIILNSFVTSHFCTAQSKMRNQDPGSRNRDPGPGMLGPKFQDPQPRI